MDAAIKSNKYACLIGWIISWNVFCEAKAELESILSKIEDLLGFQDRQRACHEWAILVYFTMQVIHTISLLKPKHYYVQDCFQFRDLMIVFSS